jgi:hypothetical protein
VRDSRCLTFWHPRQSARYRQRWCKSRARSGLTPINRILKSVRDARHDCILELFCCLHEHEDSFLQSSTRRLPDVGPRTLHESLWPIVKHLMELHSGLLLTQLSASGSRNIKSQIIVHHDNVLLLHTSPLSDMAKVTSQHNVKIHVLACMMV